MSAFPFLKKRTRDNRKSTASLNARAGIVKPRIANETAGASLKNEQSSIGIEGGYGYYERLTLYRFLRDQIPIINGAIWTWTRLCSSPMEFIVEGPDDQRKRNFLTTEIEKLGRKLSLNPYLKSSGLDQLSDQFFNSLFVDGAFAGGIELDDKGAITGFTPCDIRNLTFEYDDGLKIYYESENGKTLMDPETFIFIPLDSDPTDPRGKSILQSIGFVSRLERKLLDDMQKTQEKAGYNRLHVQVNKPERRMGESEQNFLTRANNYFDDTVSLFSGIKPADSVVTWNDIEIKTVTPSGGNTSATNSWYLSHRALVEDICAGIHLDPFMLGYSFGTTRSWARFKFELIIRQVISMQKLAVEFFEWLINSHLKLTGSDIKAVVRFNNDRIDGALARYEALKEETARVLDQYNSGLLDKDEARDRIQKAEERE